MKRSANVKPISKLKALALLKIVILANKSVVAGKLRPARAAFARIRRRLTA